eukprot:CAMPEP_0182889078 /NCGR_PEP_ID=MMETSP0034_2-20130328/21819_1 /TAXON_ID=156128 /ORGANISM="Nephroselmis pyriformis, Strain CCMP717" /LENGTH=502 /DNA_ID=CAMNT_0025022547 /DNA_START=107 /DNA_END=1612 /DNA_ORIENTATION=+
MAEARLLRAAAGVGSHSKPCSSPPQTDGILSITPDTPDAAEWRARGGALDPPPSPGTLWAEDETDEPKPSDLYGKFTWKIENFSEISKRELRSNVFEVGNYKWYILVYPQGCDVCNHLSLFLCVADYDKLLPGWSHFAQFTIAVVNKDPKKSKYSDTLHRFCKKEHDWGWKKFMELSKVLDGFTVADTLVIKAQVQVIREKVARPFRCLDCQYRRELVRVYLTNVEGICRRFVEEKRDILAALRTDPASLKEFWDGVNPAAKAKLGRERADVILKAIVKRFFNEKEVTSTLVMDALYSGCKALDEAAGRPGAAGAVAGQLVASGGAVSVSEEKNVFTIQGDILQILERAATESIPAYRDEREGDDFGKDSVERDERRLAELGKRTVEMFVLTHLFTNRLEVSYREALAIKRQEALIAEEEEEASKEEKEKAERAAQEKEKKQRKKDAKKRKKERKDQEEEEARARAAEEARAKREADERVARERRDAKEQERLAKEQARKRE